MANTTSYPKPQRNKGKRSYRPAPETLRPLDYKTDMGLAFEGLAHQMGLGELDAPTLRTATWTGTR